MPLSRGRKKSRKRWLPHHRKWPTTFHAPEPTQCPACGEMLDAVTNISRKEALGGPPEPGSYSLCVYCLVMLVFETDRTYRVLLNLEWEAMELEERILYTRLRKQIRENPPPRHGGRYGEE